MLKRPNGIASEPGDFDPAEQLAPVNVEDYRVRREGWAGRLVLFLRAVAVVSLLKGLYHWAAVCGFGAGAGGGFDAQNLTWQMATVFFAVIDLVAAVGLWLAAPWGTIIWLASSVTMMVVHAFMPQIYGFQPVIMSFEVVLIGAYGYIAVQAAREQPR